jgi:DDE family transposase
MPRPCSVARRLGAITAAVVGRRRRKPRRESLGLGVSSDEDGFISSHLPDLRGLRPDSWSKPDPLLKLAVGRSPEEPPLASQAMLSRWENAVTAQDLRRLAAVLVDQFVERFGPAPQRIVLDLDPCADACYGHQQRSLSNGHSDSDCYLPRPLCGAIDGGRADVIGALLRDGPALRSAPCSNAVKVLLPEPP